MASPPCSSESSSTILDLMTEALGNAEDSIQSRSAGNEVACRAAFRLATYAESLYRAVQEQISSPKWATAVAIIQDKKCQVGTSACLPPTCFDRPSEVVCLGDRESIGFALNEAASLRQGQVLLGGKEDRHTSMLTLY